MNICEKMGRVSDRVLHCTSLTLNGCPDSLTRFHSLVQANSS